MNDIFDVIDALQDAKRISGRKLANMAGMKPTTFASMMSRKPTTIPKAYLESIASALDVKWNDILNVSEDRYPENEQKIPTVLSERDYTEVMLKFFGSVCEPYSVHIQHPIARADTPREEPITVMNGEQVYCEQYKKAICHMLDTLNSNGLRNVMQHILELNIDPRFSSKKDPNTNKEDTEWQKEKQPMAAERSINDQMGDMKAGM